MIIRLRILAAMLALAMPIGTHAMPILLVDGSGQLIGATEVDVNSSLFDVMFVDGTCIDVFDGCDDLSDFVIQTEAEAVGAAEALLTMVFLDGTSGAFDSVPDLTAG